MHIRLLITSGDERPEYEPVHAAQLTTTRYRLEFSPGLAYGLAAGDEFELEADGSYRVVRRAGNVAVRVLCENPLVSSEPSLSESVAKRLGGRLDGNIGRGLVYTIPVNAGFPAIESLFTEFAAQTPGALWEFGNVYAPDGSPLGWWNSAA